MFHCPICNKEIDVFSTHLLEKHKEFAEHLANITLEIKEKIIGQYNNSWEDELNGMIWNLVMDLKNIDIEK